MNWGLCQNIHKCVNLFMPADLYFNTLCGGFPLRAGCKLTGVGRVLVIMEV